MRRRHVITLEDVAQSFTVEKAFGKDIKGNAKRFFYRVNPFLLTVKCIVETIEGREEFFDPENAVDYYNSH
jgi:hypothetical protein